MSWLKKIEVVATAKRSENDFLPQNVQKFMTIMVFYLENLEARRLDEIISTQNPKQQ